MKKEVALTRERILRLSLTHPDIEFTLQNVDARGIASTILYLHQVRLHPFHVINFLHLFGIFVEPGVRLYAPDSHPLQSGSPLPVNHSISRVQIGV